MKSIKDLLLKEAKFDFTPASKTGYADLTNVDATALWLMSEMALAWLKNPDKSAEFYKGDGGQTVAHAKSEIEKICKHIIDNYDDVING